MHYIEKSATKAKYWSIQS